VDEDGVAGGVNLLAVDGDGALAPGHGVEAVEDKALALVKVLVLAKDRVATVLALAVLKAEGVGRLGVGHVELDLLVEVGGDRVRLLAVGRASVLDVLEVRSERR
jgi:hypothetical protein